MNQLIKIPFSKVNFKHFTCEEENNGLQVYDVMISTNCNLACDYCCHSCNISGYSEEKLMTKETIEKTIDLIYEIEKAKNNRICNIKLYGGEPLLNKNLFYAVDYIKEKFKYASSDWHISIITNGTLFTDNIIKEICKCYDDIGANKFSVTVSIDGFKENHNLHRKTKYGKDTYDLILDNIHKFPKEYQRFIGTQAVLTPSLLTNAKELFTAIRKEYETSGVIKFFGILPMNDRTFEIYSKKEIFSMFDNFYNELLKNFDLVEKSLITLWQFKRFITDRFHSDKWNADKWGFCNAGSSYLAIDSSGDIFPCYKFKTDLNFDTTFGSVHDKNALEIFLRHEDIWNRINRNTYSCTSCKYGLAEEGSCIGGCLANNFVYSGKNKVPSWVCDYNAAWSIISGKLMNKFPELVFNRLIIKDSATKEQRFKIIGDDVDKC